MPILTIQMMEGRTQQQKEELIEQVTDAVVSSISSPRENVTVMISEIPKANFGIGGVTADKLG